MDLGVFTTCRGGMVFLVVLSGVHSSTKPLSFIHQLTSELKLSPGEGGRAGGRVARVRGSGGALSVHVLHHRCAECGQQLHTHTFALVCVHFKKYKNILPLQLFKESIYTCSSSSSSSICYLHCDFVVPHTSNKDICIHAVQVTGQKQKKKEGTRGWGGSCITLWKKQKTIITSFNIFQMEFFFFRR